MDSGSHSNIKQPLIEKNHEEEIGNNINSKSGVKSGNHPISISDLDCDDDNTKRGNRSDKDELFTRNDSTGMFGHTPSSIGTAAMLAGDDGMSVETGSVVGNSFSPFSPRKTKRIDSIILDEARMENITSSTKPTSFSNKCKVITLTCVAVAIVLSVIIRYAVVPGIVQSAVDGGTLRVTYMMMSEPTENSIQLFAQTELHDIISIKAKLGKCDAEVHHEGHHLANLELPEIDMNPGEQTLLNVNTSLIVVDVAAFTAATAKILQGVGGKWMIYGKAHLDVDILFFKMSFHVNLKKELLVPPTLLRDIRSYDSDMVAGTGKKDSFKIKATTTFFSSSILEMNHLGLFIFDLIVEDCVNANGDHTYNVTIGRVEMDDFHVILGKNTAKIVGTMIRTSENEKCFSEFLSRFQNGTDQYIVIRGPIESKAPFLSDVVRQEVLFEGLKDNQPCRFTMIDRETMAGPVVKLPNGKHVHYRGSIIVLKNPMGITISQEDLIQQVRLTKPIGYVMNHPLFGHHVCPISNDLAEARFVPGMNIRNITESARIVLPPNGLASVFIPGRPLPGQLREKPCTVAGVKVAGDFDCCFVSLQPALACYAKKKFGEDFMTVSIRGTYTLIFEEFRIKNMSLFQSDVPLIFSEDISGGFLEDGFITCDVFKFLT